jgi:DNA helicase-2/ATP-dependent DNA helicase PcrA
MSEHIMEEERAYLENVINIIKHEIEKELEALKNRRRDLVSTGKDMWENAVHFSNDFEKMTEVVQYLATLNTQTVSYDIVKRQLDKLRRMMDSPYFGRFDLIEEGFDDKEKIYIGISSLIDSKTKDIMIYDWRAPISSIYYEYELGSSAYQAPQGMIRGEVTLKRQYKIHKGALEYYFDSNLQIDDEMLQQALCRNASIKMRNIVESIQKEQNAIIRDTDNDLLMVQGVAGSGKTSVALHRIAFLLYQGMGINISKNNILIISPNVLFSKYISRVLPDLGEDNVKQLTFEEILDEHFNKRFKVEGRNNMIETLTMKKDDRELYDPLRSIEFKGSREFLEILERLVDFYILHFVEFKDIYYDGMIVETRQRLRSMLINEKTNTPIAKRMERMQRIIFEKINPLRKSRLEKLENFVQQLDGHELDIKPFSRLMAIKETKRLSADMQSFTRIDYFKVYKELFNKDGLLQKLAKNLELPDCLDEMLENTRRNLDNGFIEYEDSAPLLFLKLKLEGESIYPDIRQVVVDEAQDYSPMHYMIFKLLFKNSRFTILGDINQSIERNNNLSLYTSIDRILNKRKSVELYMNKSYRSSYEINAFVQRIYNFQQEIVSVDRKGTAPKVQCCDSKNSMDIVLVEKIKTLRKKGYDTIAVICKNAKDSQELYNLINSRIDIKLVSLEDEEVQAEIIIIPAYLAKGLEFDAVIVYNVSKENFIREIDRRLLYIACTRALHSLTLLYVKRPSEFIPLNSIK